MRRSVQGVRTCSSTKDIMDEDSHTRLQGAWENSEQKDECAVRMDDLELDYWMDTEGGQLGGLCCFQGATFGVDGSSKYGWGQNGVNSRQMYTSR
jgi:hypothetical protein